MLTCPSCGTDNTEGSKFCNECGAKLEATPVREERKVITALFCDLVGSTALGERLDAEDISRLLRDYQTVCRRRIESHGGVIEKFIGDAVVGVFGVPLAHEDDPERAVRAALRIIEDIGASDLGIEVRIGVNTGEALVRLDVDPRSGEGFATGDTMNTAARLEAAAPVMGVAVGAATYRASAEAIVYEELAPISAKGKAEPIPTWQALHPTARVGTEQRDRTPFVGRDLELSMLTQLFERSRTRPSTEFVTIIAEPGLGKSRLVRELAGHVDALPDLVTWREGRCLPYGDGISFWALGEIVKAQAGILETDDQDTLSSKLDQAITEADFQTKGWIKDRIAPLVGLETTTEPPQQKEAFTAWRRFLEQIAAIGPTVLVIEDLHWADAAFVSFLEHLAERTAGLPLLVVVTARPEVEERHPSWPPGRRSTVLSLSPLTDGDVETLITQSLPEADLELIQIVLERAGGSPLYAEQLAAMLRERALPIAGGALDETLIPASVQALIAARIDALPPEPKRVLMEASVVGKTFWSGAITSMGEHDDLEATLGELVRREFCRPVYPSTMEGDAEFSFWHALVRDVAYAELTKAERASMHSATARWIADRTAGAMGEDAEIVVHHLDAVLEFAAFAPELDAKGLTELLAHALRAAGEARMRTDVPRSIPFLERALSMVSSGDDGSVTLKLLLARGHAAIGHAASASALFEEVIERSIVSGDPDMAVVVANDLMSVQQSVGNVNAMAAKLEGIRRRIGSTPSAALAYLMSLEADMLGFFRGELQKGLDRSKASIEMSEFLGIAASLDALGVYGDLRMSMGDLAGEGDVLRAIEGMLRDGRAHQALILHYNLAVTVAEVRPPESPERWDEAVALADRLGAEADVWSLRAGKLNVLARLGRFDEVIEQADSILAWALRANDAHVKSTTLGALSAVQIHRGGSEIDVGELAELLRDAQGPSWLFVAARVANGQGDPDLARELLYEAISEGTSNATHATVAIELGLDDVAEAILAREGAHTPVANAERAMAEAGLAEIRHEAAEAIDRYHHTAGMYAGLEMKVGHARALQGMGRVLLTLGQTDMGVARLREARDMWVRMAGSQRIIEIDELLATTPAPQAAPS